MSIGSMIEITDPSDPRIGVFLNQKDAWLKAAHNPDAEQGGPDHGFFIAEGVLVVEHLLGSRFPVESIFVSHSRVAGVEDLLHRVPDSIPIYVAEQGVMDAVVGFPIHRGLLACGRRLPDPDPIQIARDARALVILEDLSNHDNVGSVFRSTAALGGEGVSIILSTRCCDPLYRKSLRVSMGHALRVPYATADDLPAFLDDIRDLGFESIALTPADGSEELSPGLHGRIGRPAMCFGAEGPGLTGPVIARSDHKVRIPMAPGVDSLNIAVAAAVTLHACLRPEPGGGGQ
jgi:tRNA G18 (ribose-2'-O)-methylase SpoU